jgi:hypothetical protein
MKLHKVVAFGNVPTGTKLFLTARQSSDRQHGLTTLKAATESDRGVYVATQQLGFKAGEELGLEGDLDRGLQNMFGLGAPAAPTAKLSARQKKLADATSALASAREADSAAAAALAAAGEADKARLSRDADKAHAALKRAEAAFVKAGGKLDA